MTISDVATFVGLSLALLVPLSEKAGIQDDCTGYCALYSVVLGGVLIVVGEHNRRRQQR